MLAFLLCFSPAVAFAQGTGEKRGEFGITVGPIFSNLTSTSNSDNFTKGRSGLGGGVFIAPRVNDRVHLELDVLVSPKGATNLFANGPQEYRLRVLEIPIVGRVSLLPRSASRDIYAIGGIGLDVRLKATRTLPPDLSNFSTDLSGAFNPLGVNVIAGAGIKPGLVRIELRYSSSLRNVGPATFRDLRVHSWSLLFGYQLY